MNAVNVPILVAEAKESSGTKAANITMITVMMAVLTTGV